MISTPTTISSARLCSISDWPTLATSTTVAMKTTVKPAMKSSVPASTRPLTADPAARGPFRDRHTGRRRAARRHRAGRRSAVPGRAGGVGPHRRRGGVTSAAGCRASRSAPARPVTYDR